MRQELHTFYMGTTGGGVWKTTNAGTTWENVSDGFFGSSSVGAVVVAPSDPNVVWVGTGSGCPRGNIMNGDGAYRSTDAGRSWTHVGLADAGLIARMVVDPRDAQVAFAAVLGDAFEASPTRGVYRTRDGGESWEQVLFASEETGAVDLVINPANPRVLYAALWRAERKPWTLIDGGEEGGVYKSVDGGSTWTKLEGGLPTGPLGRIGLALSPARPDRVWAQVTTPDEAGGLFRSDDGGQSWTRVNAERKIQVRAWYYAHLEADPQDPNTLYSMGLRFWRSVDGGATFESISTPHGDNHALWIHPEHTQVMIEANDGGANVTLDGGRSWSTLHNQPTAELYRLTVDDGFPYRLYGAQQDNSSISVPAWSAGALSAEAEWQMPGGGESGDIAVHPDRPEVVYSGNYIGLIERWDRETGERRGAMVYPELADGVAPRDLEYRFQWNAPIRLSPHDPDVLYQASHRLHRSRDGGRSWETLSDDLTFDDESKQELPGGPIQHDDTGVEVYGTLFAFEESVLTAGLLWAGTDDGRVHLSRDAGASWAEITPPALEQDSTVNLIELSRHDPGRAFLAVHRYRLGDDRPYLFATDDYGASWRSLGAGLPQGDPLRAVREDPERRGLLYAGTHRGVYLSFDDGKSWQPLALNLPVVQVADMAVRHGDLSLATHGRSFWVLDDLSPIRQWSAEVEQADAHLFAPAPANHARADGWYGGGPAPDPRGSGALLHLWLGAELLERAEEGSLGTLSVLSAEGSPVRTYRLVPEGAEGGGGEGDALTVRAGLNRLRWDLHDERPEVLDDAVMSLGYTGGTRLPPGSYRVRLELTPAEEEDEAATQEHALLVEPDPRLAYSPEDYRAGFELTRIARERLEEIHATVKALRSVREQAQSWQARLEAAGNELSVDDEVEALTTALSELEDELIQHRAEAPQDPLNFPPKLDNHYAFLYGQLNGDVGRPTAGAYQRLEDLDRRWRPLQADWQGILAGELAALNRKLAEAGTAAVLVPE